MTSSAAPSHYILHLSDTHFSPGGELLHDVVNCRANLNLVLNRLQSSGQQPDAIVLTGDLANNGEPEAYTSLRRMLEPVARRIGAQLIWVMGNHDDRAAFNERLLRRAATTDPIDTVVMVNGLRIVALDSSIPGQIHGEITAAQVAWLREVLANPAPHGSVLALHHAPVPSPVPLLAQYNLPDQRPLAEAIDGTDVRAIIGGHLHYSTFSTFEGVPVSVAAATCFSHDPLTAGEAVRGYDGGQSFNLVHVYGDRVLHTVVPLREAPTVSYVSQAQFEAYAARHTRAT